MPIVTRIPCQRPNPNAPNDTNPVKIDANIINMPTITNFIYPRSLLMLLYTISLLPLLYDYSNRIWIVHVVYFRLKSDELYSEQKPLKSIFQFTKKTPVIY